MNKICFFLALLFSSSFFVSSCAQDGTDNPATTSTSISDSTSVQEDLTKLFVYDHHILLDTVEEGDTVRHTFRFKNEGDKDLVIKNVKPSCGCTTPEWPKDPVKPGEEGEINVKFGSMGYLGFNEKKVTVLYNGSPKAFEMQFDVFVKEKVYEGPTPEDGAKELKIKPKEGSSDWSSPW